ncbi:hypothetical protein Bcep22_gp52 [Burkholderia phage Bcep22]|uniref:Scaffolding protein n=1 Tax=Burkholderia phage Bcep22 TaxID=2883944 RepID=Q6V7P1_9CAUD|nr:hypothetical protein Bcep22_gp52 [Burkholderia phage Bcep22]AAQ54985.1 hypothetical protein Bcep22_gp52 [Burkholderia phage Bcep22]
MSGTTGYSDEDLAGLTDEERAALQEDDGSGDATTLGDSLKDDPDAGGGEGAKSGTTDDANKGSEDGKKSDDDAAAGKTDDAAGDDDAGKKGDDTPAAAKPTIVPLLVAEAPADADAKLKEIGEKKSTLIEQFDNGDITAKEYQSQLDDLNKAERAIERAVDKAQTASEMRQQQEMNAWLGQVNDFTSKAHPEYSTSRVRWTALDTFVKEIAAKPENANIDGAEILRQAHEMVVADLGEATPKADTGKKDDGSKDGKTAKPLKGAKIEPPPTLGKVPASDNADIDSGRWTALDRLQETDPEAHEEKLMKMSAADRDAYLASRG